MLSVFRVSWCSSEQREQAARTDTLHRVKNAVKKCTKTIKKTSEKLAQVKDLYYLCIKQKNKRPGYPGDN